MKILRKVKEIKSRDGVLHFRRFAVVETRMFSVYVHRIFRGDEDEHLHNHPWRWCASVLLSGEYLEERKGGVRKFRIGAMTPVDYHKIHSVARPATTLFFAGARLGSWGYDVDGLHVDHIKYRENKRNHG